MSTTISQAVEDDGKRPINLLSLDAGGPRGISQLLILKNVMERLCKGESGDAQGTVKRPCEVFDMIGGVGTGGLISIFLVVLKMTADEALEELSNFVVEVYRDVHPNPTKQTDKLRQAISGVLERHRIAKNAKLIPTSETVPACKLVVPIMYKNHVGTPCILRNYIAGHEPPVDLTIFEAMLATCSNPPIFTPTTISKDFATFEYVSGDIGLSNPTREVIAEAHRAFGDERTISCLLSIGCGHPGVNPVPTNSRGTAWTDFLDGVAMNCEKTAHEVATQMRQITLYHRLCVKYGLEKSQGQQWSDPSVIAAHATAYLDDLDTNEALDRCVNTIKHGDGFTTLEQLEHSGGAKVFPPSLPPLSVNYVERTVPMEFIEKALFDEDGSIKPGPKRIVVTGIGGCGKTQLARRFLEKYKDLFVYMFFIDGSSTDTIRRDIVRHVRALGGAHAQSSFDESMALLSQATHGERLLIIDNVDDSKLELAPFLPRWQQGTILVTSRNDSRGQMSPDSHLRLDVMTLGESIELLIRGSGKPWPPAESDRKMAISVAEELGCHPIALVQAVSYMYNTGCAPGDYVTLLRSRRSRLLRDYPATSQVDMRYKTAFAAFDASYNILPPKAQDLWHLLSFFQWHRFPVELITVAALGEFSSEFSRFLPRGDEFELGKCCLKEIFYNADRWDPLELQSILATLRSHSLIDLTSAESVTLLQMHPLVHEWGRLRISHGRLHRFEAAAVRLLCCGAAKDNHSIMQYLSSHLESVFPAWESLHVNDAACLSFMLQQSGMYDKALRLDGIIHERVRHELGPDHPETVTTASDLAVAYGQMGRDAEAEKLQVEVLLWRKQLLGVGHPQTVIASANLANTYHMLGRYAEAEELNTEVLRRRKQLLGMNHPDTIHASANLATTYHSLGRYAEAEELDTEVLRRRKQLLGVDHPDTIQASASLAATYHELGRYAEAEELKAEVLRRRKQLLGLDHPHTIQASAELAVTYHALGRYAEAEELQTEVLRKRKRLLGVDHPDTTKASASLVATYYAFGRYSEAVELETEVLLGRQKMLGPDHPETIRTSAQLATNYFAMKRYDKAEELHTEVLKKRTVLLGERHPDTIRSMLYLAQTYNATQRQSEASPLAKKAFQLALETQGDGHPLSKQISEYLTYLSDEPSVSDEEPTRIRKRDRFAAYMRRVFRL